MRLTLPEQVRKIIGKLEAEGYEAYAVGGCVRDSIMGRMPSDWDITTSAQPGAVKEIFHHTVDTGIAHGTVTVLLGGGSYEVTTYRIDGEYDDCRHPKEVIFTSSLYEDLRRRDFTINAMAYNERTGLVDEFDGMGDLERGIIRCVGNAKDRFEEDALRIMRAVRFAAQLGFSVEEKTAEAAAALAPSLQKISAERIQTELVKLLLSDHPDWIRMAWELGITKQILPEFDRIMEQPESIAAMNLAETPETVGEHTLRTLRNVRADRILRLTMLLHDCGKPDTAVTDGDGNLRFPQHAARSAQIAAGVLKRLKTDRDTQRKVTGLIRIHSDWPDSSEETVRRSIHGAGEDLFPLFLEVKRADIMARDGRKREERLQRLERITHWYDEIVRHGDCLSLRDLKLTGKDLIEDGMKPGTELGRVLGLLLDEVLADPAQNERENLLKKSRILRGNG